MEYKDILVMLIEGESEANVIALASALAEKAQGKPRALLLGIDPDPIYTGDMSDAVWTEISENTRQTLGQTASNLRARLEREPVRWSVETLQVLRGFLRSRAGEAARYSDITIMGRPVSEERVALLEGVLFGSGRPLLITPPDWQKRSVGRNVVIGWNAKREAARVLADARPLIEGADKVTLVTVDAEPDPDGHGHAPGTDVAAHLARVGFKIEVRNVDGMGRTEATALLDECRAVNADLLAIGGYGHSRLMEFVFGGVTRDLIASAPLPLMLSH